jgi:hypothetical protein
MVIAAMAAAAALFTATGGQAVSPAPLLGASKVSGPPPKPGLWTLAREDCRFNLRAALTRWPDCADPLQVGETALSRPSPDKAGAARRFRYSPGDPGVLQVETGRGGPEAWSYYGFRPLAVDDEGWVIRARIWPVACPRAGCRVRTAEEVLVAVRRAEAAAFEGGEADAGRTAVWARRSQ